jgi:hypothetical protein
MLVWLLGLFSRYHWRLPLPFTHVASSLRPSPKLQRSSTSCKGDSFCWELNFGILRCSFTDTVSGGQRRLQRAQVCQLLSALSTNEITMPQEASRRSQPSFRADETYFDDPSSSFMHPQLWVRSKSEASNKTKNYSMRACFRVACKWNAWEGSILSWLKQEAHLALR